MSKHITMKDIALQMGVSTVTVSKALTDKEGVSDDVRNKIKEKATEMGYRYNSMGKAMKDGKNGNVGIIVSDRFFEDCSFYNNLYRYVVLRLNDEGYFAVLEIISQEQEEEMSIPNIVSNNKIDGLIVMGQMKEKYLAVLQQIDIPFVFLDFYNDIMNVECITSDNVFGTYQLTNYLIQMGHTRIGFVGSIKETSSIMDRYLGYVKSLLQHDIVPVNEWKIPDRDQYGRFIDLELPKDMPTAFVCNCDEIAYRLIQKLKTQGYRVPQDVSVVGFDDFAYSTICEPPLTTYKVNIPDMALSAVKSIVKIIKKGNSFTSRKVLGGQIILRESVTKVK